MDHGANVAKSKYHPSVQSTQDGVHMASILGIVIAYFEPQDLVLGHLDTCSKGPSIKRQGIYPKSSLPGTPMVISISPKISGSRHAGYFGGQGTISNIETPNTVLLIAKTLHDFR